MLRKIHSYQRPLLQCGQNIAVALQNRRRQSAAPATRLIYMQNPWSWLCNKMRLKMLQYTWDREFSEVDFKRGVKQVSFMESARCVGYSCCWQVFFLAQNTFDCRTVTAQMLPMAGHCNAHAARAHQPVARHSEHYDAKGLRADCRGYACVQRRSTRAYDALPPGGYSPCYSGARAPAAGSRRSSALLRRYVCGWIAPCQRHVARGAVRLLAALAEVRSERVGCDDGAGGVRRNVCAISPRVQ